MASAWRIVLPARAADAFSGEGARRFGGRWNSPGAAVVYASEHASHAALEILVHFQPITPRARFAAFRLDFPDTLITRIPAAELPAGWRGSPPGPDTMQLGDAWLRAGRSAVLAVPSAIIPVETNFLLNPAHPDFRRIRIAKPEPFTFDPRLLR